MSTSEFNTQRAETVALKALEFILADNRLQSEFLSTSGLSPKDIHESIQKTDFLGGVLDFLLGQEADLIRFCEDYKINQEQPKICREALQEKK